MIVIIIPLFLVVQEDIFIYKILQGGLIIMATTITVYDLENYPDNSKTLTIDQKSVLPIGAEGDEKWVLSFVTTAYSDISASTTIQDIYVREIKTGWLKSSGFVGTGGKFTIDSNSKQLKVKLDNSAGAAGGGGYYTITLDEGVNLTAKAIAEDMEAKIRALPDDASWVAADVGYMLAYMNASVEYEGGRFWIISGSVSPYYTGTTRSSVKAAQADGDICYQTLGFNLSVDSETIASTNVKEAMLASNYTTNTTPLSVNTGTGVVVGDCLMITDGINTDYFTAISGTTETSIVVCTHGNNNYVGIAHGYTTSGTKVQRLREQDPNQAPVAYYDTVDAVTRWGIKSIANQIDYSA